VDAIQPAGTQQKQRKLRFCGVVGLFVGYLCIHLDSDLSMWTRNANCNQLLRSISRSISRLVVLSLIVSLVLSLLDYGGEVLTYFPARPLERLRSVLNAAARLVFGSCKYDHVTPFYMTYIGWMFQNLSRFGSWCLCTVFRTD